MSASGPIDVNPVDVAIEMLTEALPGFESRFVEARDAVGIHGALPIAAEVSREMVMYPIYSRPAFIDVAARNTLARTESEAERRMRHARQREALEVELEPIVRPIVERVQRLAIDAVGLAPVIEEREHRAREAGRREGHAEGREAGMREGYAAGIRSIVEVLLASDAAVGEAVDAIRERWGDREEFGL